MTTERPAAQIWAARATDRAFAVASAAAIR